MILTYEQLAMVTHPLMRTLFLFLLLLSGAQAALAAPATPAEQERAQRIVHILAYVSADYEGAVQHGRVASEAEYAEQQEFVQRARELLAELPSVADNRGLQEDMAALVQAVESKADADVVKQRAGQVRGALLSSLQLQTAPAQAPSLENGARLFAQNCVSCHGAKGFGDGPQARGLEPAPTNFHDRARLDTLSPYGLHNTIRFGVNGTAMGAYPQFSDQQVWDLAFYLYSLRYDEGQVHRGQALFAGEPAAWLDRFGGLQGLSAKSDHELLGAQADPAARAVLAYLRSHPEAVRGSTSAMALTRARLEASWQAYQAGQQAQAYSLAVSAYLDGFEAVEPALNAVDPALRTRIEQQMGAYRNAIRARESVAEVGTLYRGLLPELDAVEAALSQRGLSPAAGFLSAFTILLREGLEAVLVVAAIVTLLVRANRRDILHYVHIGWIGAILLGFGTWWAAGKLIAITGANREVIEGVSAMVAVLILFYVSYWLIANLEVHKWKQFLHEKIQRATGKGSMWALAGVSFIAVYRELFETVLFYQALWVQAGPQGQTSVIVGTLSAVAVLLVLIWAIFRLGVRLPLRPFFAASSALLYLLAFVFAGKGVLALQEAGWLPTTPVAFVRIDWLGVYPTLESLALQGLLLAAMLFAVFYTFVWTPRMRPAH